MIVFVQKLSTREICRKLNISRQARLDVLLQCDALEASSVLHHSQKNEKKINASREFFGGCIEIQDDTFYRPDCSKSIKHSKGAAPELRMMSRGCGVGLHLPATRHGIRCGFLHTYHTFLRVRIALR